jgi:hypothetical protein
MTLPHIALTCRPLTRLATLPALALGWYLRGRTGRTRPGFVIPPPDSMGP